MLEVWGCPPGRSKKICYEEFEDEDWVQALKCQRFVQHYGATQVEICQNLEISEDICLCETCGELFERQEADNFDGHEVCYLCRDKIVSRTVRNEPVRLRLFCQDCGGSGCPGCTL